MMTQIDHAFGTTERSSRHAALWPKLGRVLTAIGLAGSLWTTHPSSFAAEFRAVGIVEPFVDVTLSVSVPGIITRRHFAEGAAVEKGVVLLELDSNLERLELERRRVVRDQKRDDYEGTKKLFTATKGVSKEEVDKKQADFLVATVEHDMAQEQLRRRQILAPHSGVITHIRLEVGESCQPYEPLIHLVDTGKCYLVANIEASQGRQLKLDQRVRLEVDLGGEHAIYPGIIVFLSPVVDPASGLQQLKVLFENKDGKVKPGLTGFLLSETPA